MSDPDPKQQDDPKPAASASTPDVPTSWDQIFQHPRFKELVTKANTAETEAARLRKAAADAEAASMVEQGKWKELAEQRQKDLDAALSKASQVETYEKTLQDTLKSQLEELPADLRGLVPDELTTPQRLAWLSKNKATLMKPAAQDIGAGRKGGNGQGKQIELTPEEQQLAKMYGYTPEEYAHFAGTSAEPFKQPKA